MLFFFILLAIAGVYSGILTALIWLAINPPDIYERYASCNGNSKFQKGFNVSSAEK
jgi:hypothetical protein